MSPNEPPDPRTSIQSILKNVAELADTGEIEVYDCEHTRIVGETHMRLSEEELPMDRDIERYVDDADIVLLEFDPANPYAGIFNDVSAAKSPMNLAKEAAEAKGKPVFILDNVIPNMINRLEAEGFSSEEAMDAFALSTGVRLFLETLEPPGSKVDLMLEELNVPLMQRTAISHKIHATILSIARLDEGYGGFEFTKDYTHFDSQIRDKEYSKVLKQLDVRRPDLKKLAIVGKSHAKPIAEILDGREDDPRTDAAYFKQKERIKNYLNSLSEKEKKG